MKLKSLAQQLFFLGAGAIAPNLGNRACIFMYHSVGDNVAAFTTTPAAFEKQMKYLKRTRTVVHVSELVRRLTHHESIAGLVSVTFDDGYADNFLQVFPVMKELQVPVSFFLTTHAIGSTQTTSTGVTLPMLTYEQIQEMHTNELVEFLPHGHDHLSLDRSVDEDARKEIADAVSSLERMGTTHRIFAYPKGKYTERTIEILKELQFTAAVTVRPGLIKRDEKRFFELPRVHVDRYTSFLEFRARLGSAGEWYERCKGARNRQSKQDIA